MHLSRLYHTLRPLKSIQFRNRLWRWIRRPRANRSAPPPLRDPSGQWVEPVGMIPRMGEGNRFRFLGVERSVDGPEDWAPSEASRLWSYNLHYFEDLCAPGADSRRDRHRSLLSRWVKENPPGAPVAWDPYPLSLRVVNWIKWSLELGPLEQEILDSLAIQARWLVPSLEYHLLGNHLLANAKALLFLGCFFKGAEGERWLRLGSEILARELEEQVLPDGGHFELSPMYQAIVTADMLDLFNLFRLYPGLVPESLSDAVRAVLPRMLSWLQSMNHPDGGPAFFNDSALDIAPSLEGMEAYALRLGLSTAPIPGEGIRNLGDSGYCRLQQGQGVLIMDAGEIGPSYLPGHAHADTLSVEFSLAGRRVLVNGGTSTYEGGELRRLQRSTAAHSTLELGGRNSSDVWGAFRVGKRAHPLLRRTWEKFGVLYAKCGHNGYLKSKPGLIVWRTCELYPAGLRIIDSLDGTTEGLTVEAVSRFHLHPDVQAVLGPDGCGGKLLLPGGRVLNWQTEGARVEIVPGKWYPEFGKELDNVCLELHLTGQECFFGLDW